MRIFAKQNKILNFARVGIHAEGRKFYYYYFSWLHLNRMKVRERTLSIYNIVENAETMEKPSQSKRNALTSPHAMRPEVTYVHARVIFYIFTIIHLVIFYSMKRSIEATRWHRIAMPRKKTDILHVKYSTLQTDNLRTDTLSV